MDLGRFSVSLAVKDLDKSLEFYSTFGFEVVEGGHVNKAFPDTDKSRWRILQSPSAIIGLFEGMFDNNILTFNPSDVRSIQKQLKGKGIPFIQEADENTHGPASCVLTDPDGNTILIDQH